MTKPQILAEIARMLGDSCAELGIKNTPPISWDVTDQGPCMASIYWKRGKRPEIIGAPSWAELSFGVLLRLEEGLS